MARRKKLRITPQGYLTLSAIGVLIIALLIILIATNCFGACSKGEVTPGSSSSPSVSATAPQAAATGTALTASDSPVAGNSDTPLDSATPADTPAATQPVAATSTATATPKATEKLTEDPNALKKPTDAMKAGAATGKLTASGVNLRQGPSTTTPIVKSGLKNGTALTVYAADGDFYFLKVDEMDVYGYVAKKFVKLTSALGETSDGSDQPADTVKGTITASTLAVREGASVTSKALGEYYEGKIVYIYYREGDYYYVLVAGTKVKGYMAAQFIKASGTVPTK